MGRWRSSLHRVVEALLPWYDPEAERERNRRTEEIRLNAIRARIKVEPLVEAYRDAPWPKHKR